MRTASSQQCRSRACEASGHGRRRHRSRSTDDTRADGTASAILGFWTIEQSPLDRRKRCRADAVETQARTRRYVSRITRHTLAVIMAGGRGERLKHLTDFRCKPATPFGGKFRIIDFVLSNCVNSGIRRIQVMTQYKSHSLIQHIQRGWGYLRGEFGEFVEIIPAQQQMGEFWYRGTADSLYQNLQIIKLHNPRHILVLAGDHIYKMDYGVMLASHVAKRRRYHGRRRRGAARAGERRSA